MLKINPNIDRKYRLPRVWSNAELKKFAALFQGDIINVSGWKDIDKEGGVYKDYFKNADTYSISNYKSEARGFQGLENEFFLDLEQPLEESLIGKYDVVFNHTVLEHVFHVHRAFKNLCDMTKDVVILVVPFLQQMHAHYGDYWRFTPMTLKRLFEENGMEMLYLSFNSDKNSSVYIFCIATKNKKIWSKKITPTYSFEDNTDAGDGFENYVGCHAIQNDAYIKSRQPPAKRTLFQKLLNLLKQKNS